MYRHAIKPREGWQDIVTQQGLIFPETDLEDGRKVPYWWEGAWYEFSLQQVEELERATEILWAMCLEAVPKMLTDFSDDELRLPKGTLELVRESIRRKDPSVYARFDLRYGDGSPPQMLEINGDTPTGLVETGVAQWRWKEDIGGFGDDNDQWNSVHDRLVKRWQSLKESGALPGNSVHFFHSESDTSGEEEMTTWYMADCAAQAGLLVSVQPVEHIAWNDHKGTVDSQANPYGQCFLDEAGNPIRSAFKLYPWEAMLSEEPVGEIILNDRETERVRWIEPAWKVLLSTKAILPVLWEMNPDCPFLLPAYFDDPHDLDEWISKPFQGREGDNITVHRADGSEEVNDGAYSDDRLIFQQFSELPNFGTGADGDNFAMIGSWIIDGESAGAIVRESNGPVTDYYSRVVPHVITDSLEPATGQTMLWLQQRVGDNIPRLPEENDAANL